MRTAKVSKLQMDTLHQMELGSLIKFTSARGLAHGLMAGVILEIWSAKFGAEDFNELKTPKLLNF